MRSLVAMRQADGSVVVPTVSKMMAPLEGEDFCASQAVIGAGNYLQHSGTPRVLTILAAFQDVGFTVNEPVQAFEQYLNGDTQTDLGNKNNMNIASVRQYFETSSGKQFSPQFDIVGPVVLPNEMAYYGGSNATGSDDNFSDFCKDAMEQARGLVDDWSIYDNDKDGRIELVCVIFAGYGQNQGGDNNTIWAKANYQNVKFNDALSISRFNCCAELFYPQYPDYINGTGVFIHEFSHCLGLPDLYATRSSGKVNNQGMETYSIMDYGLYNRNGFAPCPYNAWEQEVMGWTAIEELKPTDDSPKQINDLLPLIEGGKAYKLANADNDRDFIVMENVQKRGLNKYGEGHGLLVYHVDYPYASVNMTDSPNNNPGHPSVAVVPAGGILINAYLRGTGKTYTYDEWRTSMAAAPFPGTDQVTSLADELQLPNYCFWNGSTAKETGFMLNSISENEEAGAVSFTVAIDDPTSVINLTKTHSAFEGKIYDLQGCEVRTPTKGLYIVNGRKVVIK